MNSMHGLGGVLGSRVVGHYYNSRAINVYTMVTLAFNQPSIQLNSEVSHHRLTNKVSVHPQVTLFVPLISAI
jgi:hypothetical protein